MIDGLLKNPKLIEGMIGSLIRLIPPAHWQTIAKEIGSLAQLAQEFKAQLDRIEAQTRQTGQLAERVIFLENVLRNIEGAGAAFAERELYAPTPAIGGIDLSDIRPGIMETEQQDHATRRSNGNGSSQHHGGD